MLLSSLKLNERNPRIIEDSEYKKLVKSIKQDSDYTDKHMKLRPIVYDKDMVVIAGNQRYKALVDSGLTEIPDYWVADGSNLTKAQRKRFIVQDNLGFGRDDYDILMEDYTTEELESYGMILPDFGNGVGPDKDNLENGLQVVIVVAKDNINELDKLTSLYELESRDINDDIKEKLSSQRKVYVFKE
jgi:ParB-like chromosome segregation protein Spo0J